MTSPSLPCPLVCSVERVLPSLESYVKRRLGGRLRLCLEASDVVQEVALTALRSASRLCFESDAATLAWLKLAARRALIDLSRRRSTDRTRVAEVELLELASAADADDPVQLLESCDDRERLRAGLASLSLMDRTLLAERFLEGSEYVELARENHCTPAAVRVRLHRATQRLRQVLELVE